MDLKIVSAFSTLVSKSTSKVGPEHRERFEMCPKPVEESKTSDLGLQKLKFEVMAFKISMMNNVTSLL